LGGSSCPGRAPSRAYSRRGQPLRRRPSAAARARPGCPGNRRFRAGAGPGRPGAPGRSSDRPKVGRTPLARRRSAAFSMPRNRDQSAECGLEKRLPARPPPLGR
jgi:hypothetical protein